MNNEVIFDKLKEAQDSNRLVWTTELIDELTKAMDQGYRFKGALPFHEGNTKLRKGRIPFKWTTDERAEIKKCASDIAYFAEKYCTVMTDDGLQIIKLRDYQEKMLRSFAKNRFNVTLASRQIGKCSSFSSRVEIKHTSTNKISTLPFYELWYNTVSDMNLALKLKFIMFLKYNLYKLYDKLERYETRKKSKKATGFKKKSMRKLQKRV